MKWSLSNFAKTYFRFFSRNDMFPYKVRLNWTAIRNDECYLETMTEYTKITGEPMPHIPKASHLVNTRMMNAFKPVKTNIKSNLMMSIPFPHLKETIYPKSLEAIAQYNPTEDSSIFTIFIIRSYIMDYLSKWRF
jgi:hypothetical protein